MATLKLYLDTRTKRLDGTSAIRLAINNRGQTAFITLGQYIKADEWDKRLCRVRKRPDKDALNDFLLDRLNYYNRLLMQAQCKPDYRGSMTAIALRDTLLRDADLCAGVVTLKEMFERYMAREMKDGTRANYRATWRSIEQFEKYSGTISLEDISRDWVERYNLHLLNLGRSHNTRTLRIRHIEAVFNYAIDNELTTNYPFRRLHLTICETRKRNLNIDDIRTVFFSKVKGKKSWTVDAFRIIFYLIGINIRDLFSLKPENVINGRIEYIRAKTGKKYSILIVPELQELIDKYKGTQKLFSFCEKFTSSNNIAYSLNGSLGKIYPGLTTYYARHTWATLAFDVGIPKDIISLALGHSFGARVTSTYINADISKVDKANRKVLDYVLYGEE